MNRLTTAADEGYISKQRTIGILVFCASDPETNCMSMTLGEKLRHAREERGITLSEVAEQTRISPIYLESIDNDDYRRLPGGIFNRGFVKSYAKYVGVDEQEALLDYSRQLNEVETPQEDHARLYKPEVLTDERSASSMMPTVITAAIILALMTGGILWLVSYLRRPAETAANNPPRSNTNTEISANSNIEPTRRAGPEMGSATFEIKALTNPVKIIATVDGEPAKAATVAGGSPATFTPRESITINFLRWNAAAIQLTINGKTITLPTEPLDPKDKERIIFTISKDNLADVWNNGSITANVPAAEPDENNNTTGETSAPRPTQKTTPKTNAAQTPKPADTPKPQPKPAANTTKPPAANKPQ
jgi:cytoskeleton protein RodZ